MALDEHSCPALARGVRLKTDAATGEPLLLFPEGVLHLSETAHAVLSHCNGRAPVAVIIANLAEDYEATPEVLRQDVLDCLLDLYQRKLVVW